LVFIFLFDFVFVAISPLFHFRRWEIFAFALVGDIYPSYENGGKIATTPRVGIEGEKWAKMTNLIFNLKFTILNETKKN
jgi:hypothetical protein